MNNIVKLETTHRARRTARNDLPEGGAVILLFTGIQYVRDEADLKMYEDIAERQCFPAERDRRPKAQKVRLPRKAVVKH